MLCDTSAPVKESWCQLHSAAVPNMRTYCPLEPVPLLRQKPWNHCKPQSQPPNRCNCHASRSRKGAQSRQLLISIHAAATPRCCTTNLKYVLPRSFRQPQRPSSHAHTHSMEALQMQSRHERNTIQCRYVHLGPSPVQSTNLFHGQRSTVWSTVNAVWSQRSNSLVST